MLIKKQLNALVLQTVLDIVHKEPFSAPDQLIEFTKEPLLACLCDGSDGRASTCILLADCITIVSPHMLEDFKYIAIVSCFSEAQHLELVLVNMDSAGLGGFTIALFKSI